MQGEFKKKEIAPHGGFTGRYLKIFVKPAG